MRELLGEGYEQARLFTQGVMIKPLAKQRKKRAAPAVAAPTPAGTAVAPVATDGNPSPAKQVRSNVGSPVKNTGMGGGGGEKKVVQVLLAKKFEWGGKIDPTGWWMSEKRELDRSLQGFAKCRTDAL